jgi:HEAT repeat protein
MESDITEASVRTLIFLLTLVKNPHRSAMEEKDFNYFSGAVRQLEDMLSYVLVKKDYDLATLIVRAFHMPLDPAFKPRMAEALKKTSSKTIIAATISDLKGYSKGSPEYRSAYGYLSNLEQEATGVLLELLAEENDRSTRIFFLDLVKDLGKNQLTLLGEYLSDGRWYVVRNIVSILGESHADQALTYLYKVMNHKDARIRQEVIKGLITIGGKKSASLLTKFLKDKDADTQMMAVRGLAEITGIDLEEAKPLVSFLRERSLNKKEQAITLEAIRALGVIGGPWDAEFLKGYTRIRWWRSRKLQKELRKAALGAMEKIVRRQDDGGTGKR